MLTLRFCAMLFVMLASVGASAQPAAVSRTLQVFDFEERRLGNLEDLPMNWEKVDGEGLPHYVNGKLANDVAHGGQYSFRFDLNGGSLIYRYPAGRIKVEPGASYRAQVSVMTAQLVNARTCMRLYFADVDGHLLKKSQKQSELWASTPTDAGWHALTVEAQATDPAAAYLIIELALLQPALYSNTTLGERALFEQDIRGSAWFDDLEVAQVPQVKMYTSHPGNLFHRSDKIQLNVEVNDRFTDDLTAQIVVRDATGKPVYQVSGGAVNIAAAKTLGPGQKQMTLSLPDLPAGWYRATMEMSSNGQFVGEQKLSLVKLADDVESLRTDARFGIDAAKLPFEAWPGVVDVLPAFGAGRVKLAVWSERGDVQQQNALVFDQIVERLQSMRITPTACLVALPPEIASKVGGTSLSYLKDADRSLWQPQLAFLLARHAAHLDKWQLGADGSDVFVTNPNMRAVYKKVYDEFSQLVQSPDLAMPWPAWYEMEGELPATVALSVTPDVLPTQLPLYITDLSSMNGHNLSISLLPLSLEKYGREMQIRDFAQRFAYALSAGAKRIDLELPFETVKQGENVLYQPTEMLQIYRTLMAMLGGTTFKGKVPIAEGVEALLFDRDGESIMMVWDRGSQGGVKELPLNLGERPRRVDLWGNVTPLMSANKNDSTDDPTHKIALQISSMPFFLVDIDGQLAQLRASVAFDNPMVESSFKQHTRKLRFVNTYKQSISGMVKLKAPPGWTMNPPTMQFSLNPGEAFEKDIAISFPYNTFAGAKIIDVGLQIQSSKDGAFSVPLTLKIGLSDIGLQTIAFRDGNDVIVQQMITNYSNKAVNYEAFAIFPGQARQERLVTNLGAGRTTIKKYRFKDAPVNDNGKVRSGLRESQGMRVLNDEVLIQ